MNRKTACDGEPTANERPGDLLRVAILVGGHGRGSNMQAIVDACAAGELPARVGVVIGTRSDAPALERARRSGVEVAVVTPRETEGRPDYGVRLLRVLSRRQVGLICLAGYMRLLPEAVVAEFRNRILNIHPALLPLFGGTGMYGKRVHQAVIESGMQVSGCTVHIVDERYDHGPVVLQTEVPVVCGDSVETLAARVLESEHRTYVEAVRLFAEERVDVEGNRVTIRKADV